MELVQNYLDRFFPKDMIKVEHPFLGEGGNYGIVSDGENAIGFQFINYSFRENMPTEQLIGGFGSQTIRTPIRISRELDIDILLNKNNLYEMLAKKLGNKLMFRFDKFEVEGYVESVNYGGISLTSEDITATITVVTTDFKVL